ncbi:MAG: ABC transporter substrate-binding protein [Deltaproteobacteria bacterium]|nr:ABC transporter substrate-binding protein [Deltaproteobacteria bacterium]
MQRKENRIFLAVITFFVLSPSSALGMDKIRIGLSSVSALHGAVWVAEEKGLFKKHGMEPEVIVIGGGAARGVSALIAGDIQFLSGAGDAVISANLRGADVVIAASVLNKGVQRVMARPELKSPGDLKGKKVGITRFGSASHLVLGLMLRRWGMSPAEVNVVQVGSSPAMIASLEKGGIDAAVLTLPSVFVAEERGYRVLADLADMDIYYLHTMLDTTRSYLRAHRDYAARFMKGFVEGIAYFKKNKKESMEVLKKKLRTDQEGEKHLEKSYDLLASRYYERVPYPSLKGVETVLEFLAKENPKAKGADPKSFMDDSIVREIEASGFIKRLYE